jgi:hypothetical protein
VETTTLLLVVLLLVPLVLIELTLVGVFAVAGYAIWKAGKEARENYRPDSDEFFTSFEDEDGEDEDEDGEGWKRGTRN